MSKELTIVIRVPDELDPHDVLNCMIDDFFYSNRNTEDFGPHMEDIVINVKRDDKSSCDHMYDSYCGLCGLAEDEPF